jgi:hypothetical protein
MANEIISLLSVTEEEIETVRYVIKERMDTKVHHKTASLIAVISRILEENKQYGRVTVRQVYYQLVSRNVIKNSQESYQMYDRHLTTARKAGVIPWDVFEDRARMFYREPAPQYDIMNEPDPEHALGGWFRYALHPKVSVEYDMAKWEGQPYFVELWVEKDALAGFLSPLCNDLGVGLVVSRGYTSYTFKQEANKRFQEISEDGKDPVLLYLGDLDPSGYDIYRCLEDEIDGTIKRIGLHPEDVSQFGLIPNLIKGDDTRIKGFKKRYPELGNNVYELDALPPGELRDRARRNILKYFDQSIADENGKRVRHWRANFTDYQTRIKELLEKTGIALEN